MEKNSVFSNNSAKENETPKQHGFRGYEAAGASSSRKSRKAQSVVSSSESCSSATRRKMLELEAQQRIMSVNLNYENETEEIEKEIKALERTLVFNRVSLEKSSSEAADNGKILEQIGNWELQLASKKDEREYLKRRLEREVKVIQQQCRISKQMIALEDDQDVPSEHCIHSNDVKVKQWADGINLNCNTGEVLLETEVLPAQPVCGSNNDAMEQLVESITKAFEMVKDTNENVRIKMPFDKDLPIFSGKPEDWPIFYNEFVRTTNHFKLTNVENAIRLRRSLKGSARDAVIGLLDEPESVNKIIDILRTHFGRPEFILNTLIKKAKDVRAPDMNRPETFIEFGTTIRNLVARIRSMKQDLYLNDVTLLYELTNKLPVQLAIEWLSWLTKYDDRIKNLGTFGDWIEQKMELVVQLRQPVIRDVAAEMKSMRPKRGLGAINTMQSKDICPSCKKRGHKLHNCWSFQKMFLDDRWKVVKEAHVCYGCLRTGHLSKDCTSDTTCGKNGCSCTHNSLLHSETQKGVNNMHDVRRELTENSFQQEIRHNGSVGVAAIEGADGPLAIVPVRLRGPNGVKKTHALLDSGASRTLIDRQMADELGLEGPVEEYAYRGVNGQLTNDLTARKVKLEVAGIYRKASFSCLTEVMTIDTLNLQPYSIDVDKLKCQYPYLSKMRCKSLVKAVPQIIIGGDHGYLMMHRELLFRNENEPVATRCKLGWVLQGKLKDISCNGNIFHSCGSEETDDFLHKLIKTSFTTENFGVNFSRGNSGSIEDKYALSILKKTTKQSMNGCWETGLLWRNEEVVLPESKSAAYKRLELLERRMKRNPEFANFYKQKFTEYTDKGYIRKLTRREVATESQRTWYIPHFGVTNSNKPGKLRLVFDAAAESHNVSLNDTLLKGPDFIRPLITILWNFRRHHIAINGDIADMFHRVRIREQDQDSQRFLWRDGDTEREADVYQMEVMMFGATSSPASAIYVKDINADKFFTKYPEAVKVIKNDFYVDDCLTGATTIADAIELRRQISEINDAGGFSVRKWLSNSRAVLDSIPEHLRAEGTKKLDEVIDFSTERVLGLWWNPVNDTFTFKLNFHKVRKEIVDGDRPTKREMCSLLMSLYDPLGFVGHLKIKGLIMLQEIWRSGIGWDDEIPENVFKDWQKWIDELRQIPEVRIPRCYSFRLNVAESIQLHTFVDASEEAFAAVCYYRVKHCDTVEIAFVTSKVKVAPIKRLTIPRLELQAAVLGSRIATTIKNEVAIPVTAQFFWSDSRTVLSWLRSESSRFKEFVANRVGEIQENTNVSDWYWIPTNLNVADDATRIGTETELSPESRWYSGPAFLKKEPSEWPQEKKINLKSEGEEEIKKDTAIHVITGTGRSSMVLPNITNFSSYNRLLRATAMVRTAARKWLSLIRKNLTEKPNETLNLWPSSQDLVWAEKHLIRVVQEEHFSNEIHQFKQGKALMKQSRLFKFSPFIDDNGLLRIRGRIEAVTGIAEEARRPIILPSKSHFTDLLILDEHKKNAHVGQATVLNNLRQKFWIIDGRAAVKRCWINCQECRIQKIQPVIPEMASLPPYRLAHRQSPFTFTGVDFFGPMEVTVGRHHEKRWCALFCCMVTRAIHLEVAYGLSTDEMLMVLSRFIDIRGRPQQIFSDNGTNFIGANRELQKALKSVNFQIVAGHPKVQGIKWCFIPPAAPHMGGCWERLIQSVKKAMKNMLKEKFPRDQTLLTVLKAVENIVNSRPLTYVSCDPNDPISLTPNHFLRGDTHTGPSVPTHLDNQAEFLRKQWKISQILVDRFWDRWSKEYLPNLVRREKWHTPRDPLEVGDLVIIMDDNTPRNTWKRGVVTKTYPGRDGQIRVVDVKTAMSDTHLRRPVTKICPLGLRKLDSGHN